MPSRLPGQLPSGPVERSREQQSRLRSERGDPQALRPGEFCEDSLGHLWWRSSTGVLHKLTGPPLPQEIRDIANGLAAQDGVSLGGGGGTGPTGPTGETGPTGAGAEVRNRGVWLLHGAYEKGDYVLEGLGRGNDTYLCISDDPDSTSAPAINPHWALFVYSGIEGDTGPAGTPGAPGAAGAAGAAGEGTWRGAYLGGSLGHYSRGDMATNDGALWGCHSEYGWVGSPDPNTVPSIANIGNPLNPWNFVTYVTGP
jgi:hypothetical protein